jgi:hypothetical protein
MNPRDEWRIDQKKTIGAGCLWRRLFDAAALRQRIVRDEGDRPEEARWAGRHGLARSLT